MITSLFTCQHNTFFLLDFFPNWHEIIAKKSRKRKGNYFTFFGQKFKSVLAFSIIFCLIKIDLSGNTIWQLQIFKNSTNWPYMAFSSLKHSSLRSQCWMRLYLWFSNTVLIWNDIFFKGRCSIHFTLTLFRFGFCKVIFKDFPFHSFDLDSNQSEKKWVNRQKN